MELKVLKVLWMGTTLMNPLTPRYEDLAELIGEEFLMANLEHTSGMGKYDGEFQTMMADYDVIATNQDPIDPSWEGFFPKNSEKTIYQRKGGKWHKIMPGFSKKK